MSLWRILCGAAFVALPVLANLVPACAAGSEPEDIQCNNAPKGSVPPLPQMVADWVVVLCTSQGHALAPRVKDKMVLWLAPKTGTLFTVDAAPRDWKRPPSLSKYDMRFSDFAATERTGDALNKTLAMWDLAFAPQARPKIERVVQMDARSVWQGTIYNLFFYIAGGKPQWMITCVKQCSSAVPIRIVDDPEEAKKLIRSVGKESQNR